MAPRKKFAAIIAEIPFNASTEKGRGFLPPLFRALTHVSTALTNDTATDEEIVAEMTHAEEHITNVTIDSRFSDSFREQSAKLFSAFTAAKGEISEWEPETREVNLRNLLNRVNGLTAVLDREVLGFRDSDSGYSL